MTHNPEDKSISHLASVYAVSSLLTGLVGSPDITKGLEPHIYMQINFAVPLSGVTGTLKFIPQLLDVVKVWDLCRPVKFFHTKLGKTFLYRAGFMHGRHTVV